MAITTHNGARYKILRCGYPDGFAIELWRLRYFRKPLHVATVFRPESGDKPVYEVQFGPGKAPSEFVESFVAKAKKDLQEWRSEWAANFPELLDGSA